MAVTILNDKEKMDIYNLVDSGLYSKAEIARRFKVSPRTINRVIKELESNVIPSKDFVIDYDIDKIEEDDQVDDVIEKFDYTVVANRKSISISRCSDVTGDVDTASIDNKSDRFDEALEVLKTQGISQDVLADVYKIISFKEYLEAWSGNRITVDPVANKVFYSIGNLSHAFDGLLVDRMLSALKNDDKEILDRLAKFSELLVSNPNETIIDSLYDFLEATDIEIDDDGYVICWKKVRSDFMDIYTGTMRNAPGDVVEVPRTKVDPNANTTCSYGLHVCSKAYLVHYGANDDSNVVVRVAVHPSDFVAIPMDYYSNDNGTVKAKARVCKYRVLDVASAEVIENS